MGYKLPPRSFLLFSAILILVTTPLLAQSTSNYGTVLEISSGGRRPVMQMPLSEKCPCGVWFSLFDRVGGGKMKDDLPIKAVNVVARMEGSEARVKISVFTGREVFENEELVANVAVDREVETPVHQLARFGVGAFRLKLAQVDPVIARLPLIENQTQSVAVNIEALYDTLPSAVARITNLSDKPIMAMGVWTSHNGRMLTSSMPHGRRGEVVIPARGQYTMKVQTRAPEQIKAGSDVPIKFHIGTIVFQDGTFEGVAQTTEMFRAFNVGRRLQLRVLIPLLRVSLDASRPLVVSQLVEKIKRSRIELDAEKVLLIADEFPAASDRDLLPSWKLVNIATAGVVRETVSTLENIGPDTSQDQLRERIKDLIAEYGAWLENISN